MPSRLSIDCFAQSTGEQGLAEGFFKKQDVTDACRAIVRGAEDLLRPGGWLLLEIGADQAAEVRGLLEARGVYGQIDVVADLAGRDRVVAARREGG